MREIVTALCRAALCLSIIEYDSGSVARNEMLDTRRVLVRGLRLLVAAQPGPDQPDYAATKRSACSLKLT
jgi:hypothetical protein